MNIVEFLEARITEDEAAAAKLTGVAHSAKTQVYTGDEWVTTPISTERVLAECAAKRAILEMHQPTLSTVEWFDDTTGTGHARICPSCRPDDPTDWHPPIGMAGIRPEGFVPHYTLAPCPTIRALAAVYADHPDYRQEWVA